MKIKCKTVHYFEIFEIEANNSNTVMQLKEKIQAVKRIPIHGQRLVWSMKFLKDELTVSELDMNDKNFLWVITTLPQKQIEEQATATVDLPQQQQNENDKQNQQELKLDLVVERDRKAVEMLKSMEFSEEAAKNAYFKCNKDEEKATNYLMDH